MTFTTETIEALGEPLSAAFVKDRTQGGRKLDYIESWHAIAEANRIFGFDGWTRETVELACISEQERKQGNNPTGKWDVAYRAKVRVTVQGIVREGCGFGQGQNMEVGLAHESALKEAESDAMKRALMTFGNPFGLALYDKDKRNVDSGQPPANGNGQKAAPKSTRDAIAAFFQRDSFVIEPSADPQSGELMMAPWVDRFIAAVGNTPSSDALDKLMKDNLTSITHVREKCVDGLWRKLDDAVKDRHKYFADIPAQAAQ